MSDINSSLGSAGAGIKATLLGKAYTFMPFTKKMQAEYEAWIISRARQAAMDSAAALRKQARALFAKAKEIQLTSEDPKWTAEDCVRMTQEYDDCIHEARALEQDARGRMKEVDDAVAQGDYDFKGHVVAESLTTSSGSTFLIKLMAKKHHPDISNETVEAWHEDEEARQQLKYAVSDGLALLKKTNSKSRLHQKPTSSTAEQEGTPSTQAPASSE